MLVILSTDNKLMIDPSDSLPGLYSTRYEAWKAIHQHITEPQGLGLLYTVRAVRTKRKK